MSVAEGALVGLQAIGHQDKWMRERANLFDARRSLVRDHCQVVYRKLPVTATALPATSVRGPAIDLHVTRSCDLVNKLDLLIRSPESVKSVEVTYGGQRFDKVHSYEQLKTLAAIFKRPITVHDDVYTIPLCMAPFHSKDLALPSAAYHELHVYVEFREAYDGEIALYGDMHFLSPEDRKRLIEYSHEFATIQSQYRGGDRVSPGSNVVNLDFNHPVYLIYFYGLDKSKIKNLRVEFNGATYYEGPLGPLEHRKNREGLGDVDAAMILFSLEFNVAPTSTVNFSRIDKATLEIETTEEDAEVHVVGLNCQGVRYMNGMYGLVYSK